MQKKILIVFSVLAVLIGAVILASARVDTGSRLTIQQILAKQQVLSPTEKAKVVADLTRAGYNFDKLYTYSEVQGIASRMAQDASNTANWQAVNAAIMAGASASVPMQAAAAARPAGGPCVYTSSGVFWDSHPYELCAKTCGTLQLCYNCCTAAHTAGVYSDDELRWCNRYCDDPPKTPGPTGQPPATETPIAE
jgi:hypothetical protein